MADSVDKLDNVRFLMTRDKFSPSQLGIDLIQQANTEDPIVEAIVVSRRASGLIEAETSLLHNDTMAKLAEHLNVRSTFDSALENSHIAYEEYAAREEDDDEEE